MASGHEAVAGLPVGGVGHREGAAARGRAAAEGDLAGGGRVEHRVVRLHLGALDGDDRADDAVVERDLRERVEDDQRRAAGRVRPAVGVARDPGNERAVAEDERARPRVGGLLDHERRAREHEAVEDDGGVRIHREPELVGALEQRARAVRGAQRHPVVAGAGRERRRRDRGGRGVAAAVEDLHRAAGGDRRERWADRVAAGDGEQRLDRLQGGRAVVAAAARGERGAVVEAREPALADGRRDGERNAAEHRVDRDVRVGRLRLVRPCAGRGGIVGEVADVDVGGRCRGRAGGGLGLEQQRRARAVELGQVRAEEAALERQRHVERACQVCDLLLGPPGREQRLVRPERVEAVAPAGRVGLDERRAREPERLHAPEEDADVADVVTARARADPPHLGRVREAVEGARLEAAGELELPLVAEIGGRGRVRADVVHVLRRAEQLEELDRAGGPAGDVGRELLEDGDGALAPPVADRVRDLGPRRGDGGHDPVQRPVADEVADVGRDPVGARLDELVVVGLLEALREHVDLVGEHVEQLAQHAALLGVAHAVDGRQQPVELVGRVQPGAAHAPSPVQAASCRGPGPCK